MFNSFLTVLLWILPIRKVRRTLLDQTQTIFEIQHPVFHNNKTDALERLLNHLNRIPELEVTLVIFYCNLMLKKETLYP